MRVVKNYMGMMQQIVSSSTTFRDPNTKLWFKKIDENSGPRTDGQKPVFKAVSSVQFSLIKNTNATHAMGLRASKPKHVLNATTTTTTTGTPQQTTPGGLRVRISSSLYSSLYSSSFSSLHDKK